MAEIAIDWDIIILGGGPAGLTAAIYSGRAGYKVLVLEQAQFGGEITTTHWMDNYPGFPEGVGGFEFGEQLEQQAERFGAKLLPCIIEKAGLAGDVKEVHTSEGVFKGKKVIIASGTKADQLGVPGEEKLQGKGVSYCATCDGAFFRDKEVAVVGGGDTAVEEAIFLTRFASRVSVIHRRDRLRAVQDLQKKLFDNPKAEVIWDTVVKEIKGEQKVEGLELEGKTGPHYLPVAGVFMLVGRKPNTAFLEKVLELDEGGYIVTDDEMRTSIPGVFAAGDVRKKLLRQVVTAASDGAVAAFAAGRELEEML